MKRFLLALAVVSLSGCDLSTDVADHPTDPTTETFASGLKVDIPSMTKTPGGAYYKDFKVGTGDALSGTPSVVISYSEFLKDGSGVGSVISGTQRLSLLIPGLQEGMQGMRVGGERLIVIPSALGYGNSTTVPGVPPNSTLIFDLIFNGFPIQ
jgi:FKBP-type peptidyl-prolyl cis-trans isomerase